jgi:hypothetical protein
MIIRTIAEPTRAEKIINTVADFCAVVTISLAFYGGYLCLPDKPAHHHHVTHIADAR